RHTRRASNSSVMFYPIRTARAMMLAVVLSALRLSPASAQPPSEPPPRLEVTAQGSLVATTGNASTQTLGVGGDMTFRDRPWPYRAKAGFAEVHDHDELTARSIAALFRSDRSLTPKVALFGQYDFLRDEFAGVAQRHTIAGGVSYLPIDTTPHHLRLDVAI